MRSDKRISVIVVGAGYWGANLLRNVASHPQILLAGICDVDPAALKRVEAKYPDIQQFSSFEEVLALPQVDAVIIATPSGLHYEHARAALVAGKHVFVEKPMASTVRHGVELLKVAAEVKRILMVGHTFLYNNVVREVKRRIDNNELGTIYYAYSQRLNLGQFRYDSDVLWTLAPHDVSILNYWFGSRPHKVQAHGHSHVWREANVTDVCFCLLDYPDGRYAHLHLSWLDPQKERQMVVVGDKKMLVYDDMDAKRHIQIFDKGVEKDYKAYIRDFADFKTRLRAGDLVIPNVQLREPLYVEISHFIECIENGAVPISDGQNGLEVTCILQALTHSIREGGHIIPVEYPAVVNNVKA